MQPHEEPQELKCSDLWGQHTQQALMTRAEVWVRLAGMEQEALFDLRCWGTVTEMFKRPLFCLQPLIKKQLFCLQPLGKKQQKLPESQLAKTQNGKS